MIHLYKSHPAAAGGSVPVDLIFTWCGLELPFGRGLELPADYTGALPDSGDFYAVVDRNKVTCDACSVLAILTR